MLEFEKKILLSSDEYMDLLTVMGENAQSTVQTNRYYDTDDLMMNKQGITCRIREKDGKYKATVKTHKHSHESCSFENSKEATSEKDDSLFAGMGVKPQGSLTTLRTVIYKSDECEAVLDKNTYLDCTDYELEVEYMPEREEKANALLRSLAKVLHVYNRTTDEEEFLKRVNTSKSKSERFFERKNFLRGKGNNNDICTA